MPPPMRPGTHATARPAAPPAAVRILGVAVDCIDFAGLLDRLDWWVVQRRAHGSAQPCRQVCTVNPEFIVCWGAVAATNVTGKQLAIGKLRRQFFTFRGAKVLCTYHPSYLLRNPAAKKDVWEDMKLLLAEMGLPVPA